MGRFTGRVTAKSGLENSRVVVFPLFISQQPGMGLFFSGVLFFCFLDRLLILLLIHSGYFNTVLAKEHTGYNRCLNIRDFHDKLPVGIGKCLGFYRELNRFFQAKINQYRDILLFQDNFQVIHRIRIHLNYLER